jgi:hypothetical protein
MTQSLPVADGTISKGWPPHGYTGFVYTAGREQPWAYLASGLIIAYGMNKLAAWANSNPRRVTL